MLCAKLLKNNIQDRKQPLFFTNLTEKYLYSLKKSLAHQSVIWGISLFTLFLTGLLFYLLPKGFFPPQDTGMIQGISQMPDSISYSEMVKQQKIMNKIILEDPATANLSSFVGIDGTNITLNSGRILVTLKNLDEGRDKIQAIIKRLQNKLSQVIGGNLYLQPIQDLSIDTTVSRAQYQYTLSAPKSRRS